ncbi:MAG: glycosyltransferase family 2 protein [Candidatus Andersenbacteria bacterium]
MFDNHATTTISAVIITKNEEDNIERCITSVQFADEVIVVDAESKDDTAAIAKKMGARTFVRPWPGYGPQKNFGAAQATSEWLLFLDADEEVSPKLADEIRGVITNPQKDYYWLKIVSVFLHKHLHHLYGHDPRLFRKSAGAWTSYHVHEQIQTNFGQVIRLGDKLSGVLAHPLYHHTHESVNAFLRQVAEYTALDAQYMSKENRHRSGRKVSPSWHLPFYLSTRQFGKLYFYKKGILDGYAGFMWSVLGGYYEYLTAKKYLHIKSGKRTSHEPVLR